MAVKFYIYALTDPVTHLVRYVGMTTQQPASRYSQHRTGGHPTTADWIAGLAQSPGFVLLEEGESKRRTIAVKGVRVIRKVHMDTARYAETKWIKRFRRTVLNKLTRDNCAAAWDQLTNQPPNQGVPLPKSKGTR